MFERLAGKILSRLLSKYFVSDDSVPASGAEKKSWSQLGVWSGYVSLEGLELRKEVVNDYLKSKGLPFELLQCTLGRVEITVPWAKLGLSSPAVDNGGDDAAVVVVVVDGVHALLRINYEFDDEALREAAIKQRRQELQESENFSKESEKPCAYSTGFSGFLEKRLAEGILKDILEKLHIHIRDLHIRLEDVQSDPANPSAFGLTFESLHVQADEDVVADKTSTPILSRQEPQDQSVTKQQTQESAGVIRKVAQLNHFAIYWNALDYGEGLPPELSILHDTTHSSASLANALDRCISRRASSVSSPMRARQSVHVFPNHAFLLLPLDASWHARLSTDPRNLELRPALVTNLKIDDMSVQLRDFQCREILILLTEMKEHSFAKDYRQYRPSVSAVENPRAWWLYAFRIIRMELREGNMRWSWSRFEQRFALRRRYCYLYERQRREQSSRNNARGNIPRQSVPSTPSPPSSESSSVLASSVPDEGAGPSVGPTNGVGPMNGVEERIELSPDELNELKELEDGTRGDLSVNDIVLFRALVNARVAADQCIHPKSRLSRLRRMMSSIVSDDVESKDEYERLLAYLEQAQTERDSLLVAYEASFVAVSIDVHLERGCISFFSPLRSTEDLNQHRRIQQRFLDFSTTRFCMGYSLLGNYESYQVRASLDDFVGSEIRSNRKEYVIISRLGSDIRHEIIDDEPSDATPLVCNRDSGLAVSHLNPDMRPEIPQVESGFATPRMGNRDSADQKQLAHVDLQGKPLGSSECDFRISAVLEASAITLLPDGEWFHKIKKFALAMPSKKISLSSFWEEIGMAQINLLSSRRAGLLAKAETAIFNAKNIDVDFHMQCPVIHISDGRDSTLTVDLGHAHFATKRLAGVATGKLLASTMKRLGDTANLRTGQMGDADAMRADTSVTGSIDSSFVKLTPNLGSTYTSSPRRDSFFLGVSAMSILGNRTSTRSVNGNTPFAGVDPVYSCFYDEFLLDLKSTCMSFSDANHAKQSSLMDKLDVQVSIAKSVIPSDHTICRLRTQCMIQDVSVRLSESSITCLVGLAQCWIEAVKSEETSKSIFTPPSSARSSKMAIRSSLCGSYEPEDRSIHEALSDTSSDIDENEFIDALENADENENAGAWLDDNWIADAESVAESDIRSISRKKPRRRRLLSVSDVSSISDRSWGARRKHANDEYLSAENLARLEELGSEDDDGDLGSDAESFHSALSLGGYEALAEAMQEDIRRAEDEITELKRNLAAEAMKADGSPFLIPEARRRLQVRRNLRIELDRTNAELSALRATHEDLVSQLDSAQALDYHERLDTVLTDSNGPSDGTALQEGEEHELAARAKSLLRARRRRSSSFASGEAFKHKLTAGLNRELLSASFVVSKARLVFDGLDLSTSDSGQSQILVPANFEFCMTQCVLAVLRRATEWRVYAGVDSVVGCMKEDVKTEGLRSNRHLLLGGARPSFLDSAFLTSRPLEGYNATCASPDDKVLRLTFDRREKQSSGLSLPSSTRSTRLKVHVGDIEIAPHEQSVASLMKFVRKIEGANAPKASEKPSMTVVQRICRALNRGQTSVVEEGNVEYADISCRLSSVRVNLSAGDTTIASLVVTDVGARFLQGLTNTVYTHHSQLDARCSNVQLLDLNDRHAGVALLTCRDPYVPIAQLRVRTQLVPSRHTGGWVVAETSSSDGEYPVTDELAWNMHIGAKLNSVYATISWEGIKSIHRSSHSLKQLFTPRHDSSKTMQTKRLKGTLGVTMSPVTVTTQEGSSVDRTEDMDLIPIRWRGDFTTSKFSVLFPTYDFNEIDASHTVRSNALLTFSQHSSFEAAPVKVGSLLIRSEFTGVSLVRTSDEWPILESMAISSAMTLLQTSIVSSCSRLSLTVPDTFTRTENRTSLNHGTIAGSGFEDRDCGMSLSISMGPTRFNLSAQTCCLLLNALKGLQKDEEKAENVSVLDGKHMDLELGQSSRYEVTRHRFMKVYAENLEVKLLRESGRSTSLSFADPLTLLIVHEIATSVSQDSQSDKAAIEIREVSLYDLSSLPGTRVLGINSSEMSDLHDSTPKDDDSAPETIPLLSRLSFSRGRETIPSVMLKLQLRTIQCLLLPSTLQTLLAFRSEVTTHSMKGDMYRGFKKPSQETKQHLVLPFGARQLEFAFHVTGFECILPSKDLFSFIRRRPNEPVSVVTFRWTSELTGKISCPPLPNTGKVSKVRLESLARSALDSRSPDVCLEHLAGQSQSASCMTALARLRVDGFQVLRTNVKRSPLSVSATGDKHISPNIFMIHPPVAGEQRITNPFWFSVSYQIAVVSRCTVGHEAEDNTDRGVGSGEHYVSPYPLSISQAIHVDAGFVDALVYIRQSAGGINDALRVTVKPIFDMLKKTDESDTIRTESQVQTQGSKLMPALQNATTICSLQAEGIQVTCVPGGATRLTESPIAKCELSHLRLGMVTVALPVNHKVAFRGPSNQVSAIERLKQAGLERFGVIEPVISGGPGSHITLGGWIQSELSASYHNRRLVAWEPFIEPWVLHVRAGIDLVRAFNMAPSPWIDESSFDSNSRNPMSSFNGEGAIETTGERIRDFGRLLRSPFSPDSTARKKHDAADGGVGLSSANMSYVMMKSIEPNIVATALYPAEHNSRNSSLGEQIRLQSFNSLPESEPIKLLEQFGYPALALREKSEYPAMLCSIFDTRPLNVNVTGALIENVLGFVGGERDESSHPIAPHLIRNASGLTVRFQEYLDVEQLKRGKVAKKIILSADCEIPLSLTRSMSQSCDPHRAYISLELGSFEDTAGRINHQDFNIGSRSHSSIFFYKAKGKIPVDTVGVHKYALCHRIKRRKKNDSEIDIVSQGLGNVIVRVALQGAIKLVSIESPLILKNNSEVDLLCELRNHGGVSLLWRSLVPKALTPLASRQGGLDKESYVSLPVDLVAAVDSNEATLSVVPLPMNSTIKHESDVPQSYEYRLIDVDVPPPFSKKSVARGLIKIFESNLGPSTQWTVEDPALGSGHPACVNLNTCAVRIGSMSLQESPESSKEMASAAMASIVPEQRMLFFRPPLVIRNHLPVAIKVQARVKYITGSLRRMASTASTRRTEFAGIDLSTKNVANTSIGSTEWHDLGTLACGKSLSWTGATAADKVEVRVRMADKQSEYSGKFQDWSTCVVIPSEDSFQRSKGRGNVTTLSLGQLIVLDDANARLRLSVSLEFSSNSAGSDSTPSEDVRWFAQTLPCSPRVVGIFVPFWIIDSTCHNLEFVSNAAIAGQTSRCSEGEYLSHKPFLWAGHDSGREQLGLAELLEDEKLSFLSARSSFEVLLIGDEKSTRLRIRRRVRVFDDDSGVVSKWCDPIALNLSDNSSSNVLVPPPTMLLDNRDFVGGVAEALEPLAIRTRIIASPEEFGGIHGTKLIHVVSRYRIVNEMGREIEVIAEYGEGIPMVVGVDARPVPFHFDGKSPIRFRPKEFGWAWSGRFSVRKKRREVTLRLVHKLKGQVIIGEVEFIEGKNSSGNVLVFREASHPPFRLDNQTMQALHFGQSSVIFGPEREHASSRVSLDSTILPYHHAEFAWDEPDEGRRKLVVEIADLGGTGDGIHVNRKMIGRFDLDRMAPGTQLRMSDSMYSGQIVADGPTRVLRITDSSLPLLPSTETPGLTSIDVFKRPETVSGISSLIEVGLTHGIGVSVVDWSPQELLYIQLDEITAARQVDSKQESVSFGISCCSVDNQLWVTPFPVLLRMGHRMQATSTHSERTRRRRSKAIAVSWRRALNSQGDLTLVDNFELSTEPAVLCVDGYVSELLWAMARQISEIRGGIKGASTDSQSRDAELRRVLRIGEDRHGFIGHTLPNPKPDGHDDSEGDSFDGFLTAALAAKLRLKPRTGSISSARPSQAVVEKQNSLLSKKRSKYYVGKWKISTTQMEISWSGPLPGAFIKLPNIMRPALTFEALPVLLRPYSNSHAYGAVDDLANDLKSHYLSIWRVLDVLVGLTFRPSFLIRACIYTSRERCADAFDSISNTLTGIEKGLVRVAEPEATTQLLSSEISPTEWPLDAPLSTNVYHSIVRVTLLTTASLFRSSARLISSISSMLRYGGSRESSRNPASGSVRARNPRLFAHQDGKDLLVEYVEGENAGKAILSRVRAGRHLGEGYVFHCENVHLQTAKSQSRVDLNSPSLICMVTSERVFLLNGDRQVNFCAVVWESTFLNLVELEIIEFEDASFDLVKLWYLVDTAHAKGNGDTRLTRYAKAMVCDADWGLDILLCKSLFVPTECSNTLRSRIAAVHRFLDDTITESL